MCAAVPTQAHDHKQELYTSTPHHLLDWDRHRWPLALREVQHWQPDVLCLQEVSQGGAHEEVPRVRQSWRQGCVEDCRARVQVDHWPEVQQALAALG